MDSLIKKFIAEILGTFVFLGVIITVVNKKSLQFSEVTNSFKIGLSLTIAICLFGSVSGGNFNPAVSLMLYLNNQLTRNELFVYILGQIIGALLAYYIFHLVIK
jgi:aquaporin Z